MRQFLANPLVKPDAKKAVIQQIAGEELSPSMHSFLKLLVDKGRILFLEGIGKQYLARLQNSTKQYWLKLHRQSRFQTLNSRLFARKCRR